MTQRQLIAQCLRTAASLLHFAAAAGFRESPLMAGEISRVADTLLKMVQELER